MKYLVLLLLAAFTLALTGCVGDDEFGGIRKPRPEITRVVLDRQSSTAALYTNRSEFSIREFRVYRMVSPGVSPLSGTGRRYLDFQLNRVEVYGNTGNKKAIFVLSTYANEALNFVDTYYAIAGIEAQVWDYGNSNPDATKPAYDAGIWQIDPDGSILKIF